MTEHKTLENWFVGQIAIIDEFSPVVPVIRGFVDGKFTNFAPLLWLDLEKKILMTDKDTYKIGKPNQGWLTGFLSEGNTIGDLEIKAITH
jgi:hypothetical protein